MFKSALMLVSGLVWTACSGGPITPTRDAGFDCAVVMVDPMAVNLDDEVSVTVRVTYGAGFQGEVVVEAAPAVPWITVEPLTLSVEVPEGATTLTVRGAPEGEQQGVPFTCRATVDGSEIVEDAGDAELFTLGASGTPNQGFGTRGTYRVRLPDGRFRAELPRMAALPDGGVLVVSSLTDGSTSRFELRRHLASGQPKGAETVSWPGVSDDQQWVHDIHVLEDGRFLLFGGSSTNEQVSALAARFYRMVLPIPRSGPRGWWSSRRKSSPIAPYSQRARA
ncbi:MAG: hypothetical protein AAGA48_14530 [Myxococcota bacterium]